MSLFLCMGSENVQISFCYMWLSSFSSTTYSVLVTQSHPTLFDPMDCIACQAPLSMEFSSKNTGVGSHALLQRSSWPRYQTQASFIAGILYHLNQRLFFSIVYSHLLCHRLIDGECVGLLPGFLSCSWILTKKDIFLSSGTSEIYLLPLGSSQCTEWRYEPQCDTTDQYSLFH